MNSSEEVEKLKELKKKILELTNEIEDAKKLYMIACKKAFGFDELEKNKMDCVQLYEALIR